MDATLHHPAPLPNTPVRKSFSAPKPRRFATLFGITYHKGHKGLTKDTKFRRLTPDDENSFVPFVRPSCPFGPSPQGEAFVVFR
jgi:hypothetical protein